MTVSEAKEKLKRVNDLFDFQELFFSSKIEMDEFFQTYETTPTADFEIVYKTGDDRYTTSPQAKTFDMRGSCTNSYMKLEDGYVEYPF